METAVKLAVRIALIGGWIVFAIYTLYWLMGVNYLVLLLAEPGGWKLWFDANTREGIALPIFLWFVTLFNPFTLFWACAKVRGRFAVRNSGVPSV